MPHAIGLAAQVQAQIGVDAGEERARKRNLLTLRLAFAADEHALPALTPRLSVGANSPRLERHRRRTARRRRCDLLRGVPNWTRLIAYVAVPARGRWDEGMDGPSGTEGVGRGEGRRLGGHRIRCKFSPCSKSEMARRDVERCDRCGSLRSASMASRGRFPPAGAAAAPNTARASRRRILSSPHSSDDVAACNERRSRT